MTDNTGVPPSGSGYSAEPEPSCTVSAVPVSIPNAVTISGELYAFLMGEGPMEGVWFGELNEGFKGAFWWRGLLRCAAGWPDPTAETETATYCPPRPVKLDEEMLAILLWDYFGGRKPRGLASIARGVPKATEDERLMYRKCATKIAKALESEAIWRRSRNG